MNFLKLLRIKVRSPKRVDWEIDSSYYDKLSINVITQVQVDAEKRFESTVDDINRLRSRAYSLLTVFISLLSAVVALYFADHVEFKSLDKHFFTAIFFINIIILAYAIIQLLIVVQPGEMMVKGEEPNRISYDNMIQLSPEEQDQTYLFDSLGALQGKIHFNELIIQDKNDRLENIIFVTGFQFVVTLLLILILN